MENKNIEKRIEICKTSKQTKEMFEELGFKYEENSLSYGYVVGIKYTYDNKSIFFDGLNEIVILSRTDDDYAYMNMKLLKAINQQCKELGWFE